MEPVSTFAIGIDLHLVDTGDGGRQSVLLGGHSPEHRFEYRPNWGLPGWPDGDQTAGPVLGFTREGIQPGDDVRAVLVALFPEHAPDWRLVEKGSALRMYEGWRVCGVAVVDFVEPAKWPMSEAEQEHFVRWLDQSQD